MINKEKQGAKMIEKKALIGFLIIIISTIFSTIFENFLNDTIGRNLTIIIYIILFIIGFYLCWPYVLQLGKFDNKHNKFR